MTTTVKRQVGIALIVLALILAGIAAVMWQHADSDAEKNPYASVFGVPDPPAADHTPSIIALAGGGLSIVCGVILLATAPVPESKPNSGDEGGKL